MAKRRPTPRTRGVLEAPERPSAGPSAAVRADRAPSARELEEREAAEPLLADDGIEDPMEADGVLVEPEAALTEAELDQSVGRSAAMMSVLVVISRVTGFLRTSSQAWALGATMLASCYTVANNLPNQLYELVMGGMLVTAFLPVYMSVKRKLGTEGASAYASNLVSLVVLAMGALAILGFIFAAQVVWTQSFGATADFDHDLATWFFRFFTISIVLYGLSSVFSGVLNAERDYFWSTAAPIANNIIICLVFFAYGIIAPHNPQAALLVLALGNPLGILTQVILQVPSLKRHGIRFRPYFNVHDPAIKETLSIGLPSLIVTFTSFVTVSVMQSSALSVTASGAAINYYSRLWYTLPYAVLAIPVTTAMFTELSDAMSANNLPLFVRGIWQGSSRILFFLVPFMLYLVVFAPCLVALLGSGSFTAEESAMNVEFLRWLSLALPFYGLATYLQKICSAWRHMLLFAAANVVASVVQLVICLWGTPVFGLPTVPVSSVIFFILVDGVTYLQLRRGLGPIGMSAILKSGLRSLALGGVGAALGWGILFVLTSVLGPAASLLQAAAYCVVAGVPALVGTFGLALLAKVPEASFISGLLNRVRHV